MSRCLTREAFSITSPLARLVGELREIRGDALAVALPKTALGAVIGVETAAGTIKAVVIGFDESLYLAAPLRRPRHISPGDRVTVLADSLLVRAGPALLGSIVGPFGEELERIAGPCSASEVIMRAPDASPTAALDRKLIRRQFETGVRAIDTFVPIGFGQRLVVFAEPGVGKSTLVESMLRARSHAANVVALVGERAREVLECVELLKSSGAADRTVVVASTGDEPAISRVHAAWTAATIAEALRDCGDDVLLIVDSMTRFCRALRDLGISAGEPPLRRGYCGSVYSRLPEFIERAGTGGPAGGSITALYTALLSGELEEDPMVEEIRGICDGHLVLSRTLAERGHFPAIDILRSLSRVASQLQSVSLRARVERVRALLSTLEQEQELVALGAAPSVAYLEAKRAEPALLEFLRQPRELYSSWDDTARRLDELIL